LSFSFKVKENPQVPHLAMSLWCWDVTFHLLRNITIPDSWNVMGEIPGSGFFC